MLGMGRALGSLLWPVQFSCLPCHALSDLSQAGCSLMKQYHLLAEEAAPPAQLGASCQRSGNTCVQVPSLPETANQSGAVLGDKPQAGQNYSQTQAAFGRVTIYFFFN